MAYIGVHYFNSASCKGNDSEAFGYIVENDNFKLTKKQKEDLQDYELRSIESGYYNGVLRIKNIMDIIRL